MTGNEFLSESVDTIEDRARRKETVSDPDRLRALYRVATAEEGQLTADEFEVAEETLEPLVEVNLLGRIPAPGDTPATYRITRLGKDEVV